MTAEEIADLASVLSALSEVEFAQIVSRHPSPAQAGSGTGDFTDLQDYLGADPGGNFDYASAQGLDGDGIRVTEISATFDEFHEELLGSSINMESQFISIGFHNYDLYPDWILNWLDHGTATLGMLLAEHNGIGIDGMTPNSSGYLYPIFNTTETDLDEPENYRINAALCNALVDSEADGVGNVVYIEVQDAGLPVEVVSSTFWELTRLGTDAGVVVVAAAGNGSGGVGYNLDSSQFEDWRDCGDSGALLVGAGTADKNHDRLGFSNYGQRVHPHAWGESVVTLGCGDLYGGDPNAHWGWQTDSCTLVGYESTTDQRYTETFNGTSSATPMVTAAAVLVQEHTIAQGLTPLDSVDMRHLLTHTGIPQGTAVSGHIGPFINVKEAIQNFDIADLAVQTNQVGNTPFTTFIANQGPRVARDVEVEIVYGLWFGETLTAIDIPDGCEWFSYPPGTQCPGSFCPPKLVCTFDRIEPNQPMEITLNYCGDPAQGGQGTMQVDTQALMNGELTDNNLANNVDVSTVDNGKSCGIAQ